MNTRIIDTRNPDHIRKTLNPLLLARLETATTIDLKARLCQARVERSYMPHGSISWVKIDNEIFYLEHLIKSN